MQEQLITFETAKLAKEKGFNELVIHYYTPKGYCTESEGYRTEKLVESNWNNGQGNYPTMPKDVSCSAPTQSLLQKWLREEHNIEVHVSFSPDWKWNDQDECLCTNMGYRVDWGFVGIFIKYPKESYPLERHGFKTYEEALEAGLQAALELINN